MGRQRRGSRLGDKGDGQFWAVSIAKSRADSGRESHSALRGDGCSSTCQIGLLERRGKMFRGGLRGVQSERRKERNYVAGSSGMQRASRWTDLGAGLLRVPRFTFMRRDLLPQNGTAVFSVRVPRFTFIRRFFR